ncbi:unannotated protein [freshwater metagenome]|uniref:Unannotated protein n=1 Tax=freshwater metagenome TaxID=449393 RepID=A0A6J5ZNF5_9ZZZZ
METLTTALLILVSFSFSVLLIYKGATGALKSWRESNK